MANFLYATQLLDESILPIRQSKTHVRFNTDI